MKGVIDKEIIYNGKKFYYSTTEKTSQNKKMLLFIDPIIADGFKFWVPFVRMKELAETYKMVYVRGYYGFDENDEISCLEDIVDVYHEIMLKENCKDISFISYSFGSYAGNLLNLKYENIVSKAIFISPVFQCTDRTYQAYMDFHERLMNSGDQYFQLFVRLIEEQMSPPSDLPLEERNDVFNLALENGTEFNPLSTVIQSTKAVLEKAIQKTEACIYVDAVAIFGENDYMAPSELQEELRENYVSLKEYVLDGGHDVIHKSVLEIKCIVAKELEVV